jgi:hypothetical protein
MTDANWFDNCAATTGTTVTVTLSDTGGNVVYQQSGTKVGPGWTQNQVTSTAATFLQFNSGSHDRVVVLGNGDRLHISGKNSVQSGCWGSLGDGYGLWITDSTNTNQSMKLIAMSYRGSGTGNVRNFNGWSPAQEIGYSGAIFDTCNTIPAFNGTLVIDVGP